MGTKPIVHNGGRSDFAVASRAIWRPGYPIVGKLLNWRPGQHELRRSNITGRFRSPVLRIACAAVFAALGCLPAAAEGLQADFGKRSYRLFCVGCHGIDGRGNGEAARALDMDVGDLTLIARRNGGVFPAEEVAAAIAGLSDTSGHKRLAMEPWTKMFAQEFRQFAQEHEAVNALVARRINHIVAYLESIQR